MNRQRIAQMRRNLEAAGPERDLALVDRSELIALLDLAEPSASVGCDWCKHDAPHDAQAGKLQRFGCRTPGCSCMGYVDGSLYCSDIEDEKP